MGIVVFGRIGRRVGEIAHAPVGLEKLARDREEDTLSWKAPETGHWKGEVRHFDSLGLIAQGETSGPAIWGVLISGAGRWKERLRERRRGLGSGSPITRGMA
jgi:hypothetical protein